MKTWYLIKSRSFSSSSLKFLSYLLFPKENYTLISFVFLLRDFFGFRLFLFLNIDVRMMRNNSKIINLFSTSFEWILQDGGLNFVQTVNKISTNAENIRILKIIYIYNRHARFKDIRWHKMHWLVLNRFAERKMDF